MKNCRRTMRRLLAILLVAGIADLCRTPTSQITGWLYVNLVRVAYQPIARPLLKRRVRCRYCPSCSDYSIEAVSRFGTVRGLVMTIMRVSSCTADVPPNRPDPVPTLTQDEE
jgi:uncharacterized protein